MRQPLTWGLLALCFPVHGFIQHHHLPRQNAVREGVRQGPRGLACSAQDNDARSEQAGLAAGLGALASGLLGSSPAAAAMDAPELFGLRVPRSVYVAWQEAVDKSAPLRARLSEILSASERTREDGKQEVDLEVLSKLLGQEAEGLVSQLKAQLSAIDTSALSVDRAEVEQAAEAARQALTGALAHLDGPMVSASERATGLLADLPSSLYSHQAVQSLLTFLKLVATNPGVRLQTEGVFTALVSTVVVLLSVKALQPPPSAMARLISDPDLPTRYDVPSLEAYYGARPSLVLGRLTAVLSQASGFLVGLATDYFSKRMEQNEAVRAAQLKELITSLGPVFIKVGQLMSVRPDLLGPGYLQQLQQLQDMVPPFSSADALRMIEAALPPGQKAKDVFMDLRAFDQPVAAASLGQVYRATLKDGSVVAVKVQRPQMLEAVTLDLFTTRLLFSIGAKISPVAEWARSCREINAILDSWGGRFIQELDYLQEARNSRLFYDSMQGQNIITRSIVVPRVYDSLTSRGVLVSEWIEGRKLSSLNRNDKEEREKLQRVVQVLLNSYLTQLLETGVLHADPHPGNFLLTNDGRLCILDFGLMTTLEEDKRIALVEYVAHLTAKDYNATVVDLCRLGFIPPEIAADEAKRNIVAPVLGQVLEQLSAGGGAKAVNVEDIGAQVEVLAKQYPLTLPPWFALIIRTFSALEGLGLSLDDKYSIVNGCYPYLARRLLTDDRPRIRAALKSFLYGSENSLKVERVNEMMEAYRDFNEAFSGFTPQQQQAMARPAVAGSQGYLEFDQSTVEALKILFSRDENYVQQLVVDEMVRMTDAAIREVTGLVAKSARATPVSILDFLPRIRGGPLGTLVTLPLLPLITLLSIFSAVAERAETLSQLTEEDRESLKTLRRLLDLLSASIGRLPMAPTTISTVPFLFGGGSQTPAQLMQTAISTSSALAPYVSEVAPGAVAIGRRFLRRLTSRILTRLADELAAS